MAQSQQSPHELHIREAHDATMTSTFVILMPLGAILVYLPAGAKRIPYIHAPFQIFTLCLAVAGLVLGVLLCSLDQYGGYHPIIGYVIVGVIILVQPTLGLWQHLLFRSKGQKTVIGSTHRWLGRCIAILGMINGGLGFRFAGPVGSDNVPKWSVVVYSVVAGLVAILYTAFVIRQTKAMAGEDVEQTKERYSYDSERPFNDDHGAFSGSHSNNVRGQGYVNGRDNSSTMAPIHDRVT